MKVWEDPSSLRPVLHLIHCFWSGSDQKRNEMDEVMRMWVMLQTPPEDCAPSTCCTTNIFFLQQSRQRETSLNQTPHAYLSTQEHCNPFPNLTSFFQESSILHIPPSILIPSACRSCITTMVLNSKSIP